jgi:hypothetical protein
VAFLKDIKKSFDLFSDANNAEQRQLVIDNATRGEFIEKYKFSIPYRDQILAIDSTNWDSFKNSLKELIEITESTRSEKSYKLGDFGFNLSDRGFSQEFLVKFQRVAFREIKISRKTDLLTIHLTDHLSVRNILALENSLNQIYREILLSSEAIKNKHENELSNANILEVRAFTHPSSSELHIVLNEFFNFYIPLLSVFLTMGNTYVLLSTLKNVNSLNAKYNTVMGLDFYEPSSDEKTIISTDQKYLEDKFEVSKQRTGASADHQQMLINRPNIFADHLQEGKDAFVYTEDVTVGGHVAS